jgi:sRNA-binding regulator protein Hfq
MKQGAAPSGKKTDRSLGRRRQSAAETTYREAEYIDWLSKNRIPVVVKLVDGEEARGWIEYYDRNIIRLTRPGESSLFIFKDRVKYLYEEPATFARRRNRLSSS